MYKDCMAPLVAEHRQKLKLSKQIFPCLAVLLRSLRRIRHKQTMAEGCNLCQIVDPAHPMPSLDTREVILEARELTREFDGVKALDGFSFKLHRGEVLGLLGANGAGKTTAMNCLLGLTLPTSGGLYAFGLELQKHRIDILRRANFSSAYTSLPGNLLVWQNLTVFARIYGVRDPRKRIDELLEMMEISHLRKRVTGQLSAGESTRVNLCKAFLNQPELLMLDEPTASLDPDIADKVRKVVRRVQAELNCGILYTSHNMKDIEEVCDRVIFLHKGKIVMEGSPAEIVERSQGASLEDVFIKIARDGEIVDEAAKPTSVEPS